jgi:hypothetical protein
MSSNTGGAGSGTGGSGTAGTGTAGTGTAGTGTSGAAGSGTAGSGTAGSGGAAACVSGAVPISTMINFDTALEGWKVTYTSAGTLANGMAAVAVPQSMVMVSWDGTDDAMSVATSGSVQSVIPYTTASQYVGIGVLLSTPINLTGRIVHAWVQIKAGVDTDPANLASHGAGSKIYLKSGMSYEYVAGTYTPINTVGAWQEITIDTCNPDYVDPAHAPFDPSDIREMGIQFDTDGMAVSPTTGTLLIDSVQY